MDWQDLKVSCVLECVCYMVQDLNVDPLGKFRNKVETKWVYLNSQFKSTVLLFNIMVKHM